jgi:CheY-like chemotaxis protein
MTAGAATATQRIRVLLFGGSAEDRSLLENLPSDPDEPSFQITGVDTLREGVGLLGPSAEFDLIVASLQLQDSNGFGTLKAIRTAAAGIPVVIVAPPGGEALGIEALRHGAQDYLIPQSKPIELLARRLRFAVERARHHSEGAADRREADDRLELADWESLRNPPPTELTSRNYHGSTLRETFPELFSIAAARYGELLRAAVERRAYRVSPPVVDPVQALADSLGEIHAGPRDIIEVHLAALKESTRGLSAAKAHATLEESRLLVLDLMGKVAGFYRCFHTGWRRKGELK